MCPSPVASPAHRTVGVGRRRHKRCSAPGHGTELEMAGTRRRETRAHRPTHGVGCLGSTHLPVSIVPPTFAPNRAETVTFARPRAARRKPRARPLALG